MMNTFSARLLLFVVSFLVLGTLCSQGQTNTSETTASKGKPGPAEKPASSLFKFGVFGNIHAGVTSGFFSNLENDLKKEPMFRDEFRVRRLGTNYGGEIWGLIGGLGNGLLVGIGGTGFNYDASLGASSSYSKQKPKDIAFPGNPPYTAADSALANRQHEENSGKEFGESRIHSYYYTIKVGYAVINKDHYSLDKETGEYEFRYRWLLYPYLGLGLGGKSTLRASNFHINELYMGGKDQGVEIPRAEFRDFTTRNTVVELGVSTRFFMDQDGGLAVGADAGAYFNVGGGKWEGPNGQNVRNVNAFQMTGVYLRATVGGGFFMPDDDSPSTTSGQDAYVKPETIESNDSPSNPDDSNGDAKKKKKKKKENATE
jgi:hypothetical protein